MRRSFVIASLLLCISPYTKAQITATHSLTAATECSSRYSLAVLRGDQLPALLGSRVDNIQLFRNDEGKLRPIRFQVDRKDELDRYLLAPKTSDNDVRLDGNDEIVFMQADAGSRLQTGHGAPGLIELKLGKGTSQPTSWLYAQSEAPAENANLDSLIRYQPEQRSVRTPLYTIGFSAQYPFLVNSLNWKLPGANEWSPDISDTMKIRHRGSLLGLFAFHRTQEDYRSKLVASKSGPLRIILRTENRVRIWWKLGTPALYIDYVMMPDGFVMDSIIDIPFNIGLFMSDVETLTTVDWNPSPELPPFFISSPYTDDPLPIDGSMSPQKQSFNGIIGDRFSVSSSWGTLETRLEIPQSFPIEASLYLQDRMTHPDPPEERSGEFGNVGFLSTGWEKIDTEVHHLKFTVCMYQ